MAGEVPATATIEELREALGKELPPGIEVEFDEQFEAMFSYKAKNYALLTQRRRRHHQRRRAQVARAGEIPARFPRGNDQAPHGGKSRKRSRTCATNSRNRFASGEMPIEMLMKTDTLQDSLDKYRAKIGAGGRNQRRRLRTRAGQRPQLQTGRPDQLLHQSDAEEGRGLRSRQAGRRLRPAKSRRECRLLRREAG